ncbi:hypothetical protein TNCV_3603541 [Trichonephila clavipes]|nr:hypothetical protein TNCV_3603541 [Trichonephila clavipes]
MFTKGIVPSRYGDTLNIHRAESPIVWLVEEEERWEASDHSQGVLPQNWGEGTSKIVLSPFMVLNTKANDRRKPLALSLNEFLEP